MIRKSLLVIFIGYYSLIPAMLFWVYAIKECIDKWNADYFSVWEVLIPAGILTLISIYVYSCILKTANSIRIILSIVSFLFAIIGS